MITQIDNFILNGADTACIQEFAWNSSGTFLALNFTKSPSIIHLFQGKTGQFIKALPLPGHSLQEDSVGSRTFSWVPGEGSVLAAVSSVGHVSLYFVEERNQELQIRKKHLIVPFSLKLFSRHFQGLIFSKGGDLCIIITGAELIVMKRNKTNPTSPLSYEFPSTVILFSSEYSPDFVTSADIHPSGTAIALASCKTNCVLILALNNCPEIHDQLSQEPLNYQEQKKNTESSRGEFVLNEIKLATGRRFPISCSWSKYGESLAFASSDNYISVWNVPSRQIDTVAFEENTVIRSLAFLNDVYVAVCVNDTNRILIVNVDDGILYDSNETAPRECSVGSKCKSLGFTTVQSKGGIILSRSGKDGNLLSRWRLSVN